MASAETISASASNPSGLAGRYALALLGLADDRRQTDPGTVDRIAADLDRLFALWRDDEGFRAFVADPRLGSASQKKGAFAILDRVGIGAEVRNLIGVLIANRRLSAAAGGRAGLRWRCSRRAGGQQIAQVTSAHPLNDTQRTQLSARLTEAGFSGVKLAEQVDPSILGGLILRIGSRLYDNSIKSKLQRLQYAMKGAA